MRLVFMYFYSSEMKKIIFAVLLITGALNAATAQFTKAKLRVDGLTCSLCANATYKQLKTLDFIDSIAVDLDHATFLLYFNKDKSVDFDKIRMKVESAGYKVGMLKASYNFAHVQVDSTHCFNLQNTLFCFINVTPGTLNGETEFQIVDGGFVSSKENKKYANYLPASLNGSYLRVFHVIQ